MSARKKTDDGYEIVLRNFGIKHKVVPADAIVIERGDLPEVRHPPGAATATVEGVTYWFYDVTAEYLRDVALRDLAMSEYLRAHPPVDEVEVKRLTTAIYRATEDPNDIQPEDVARRLYLAGVRAPEVTE